MREYLCYISKLGIDTLDEQSINNAIEKDSEFKSSYLLRNLNEMKTYAEEKTDADTVPKNYLEWPPRYGIMHNPIIYKGLKTLMCTLIADKSWRKFFVQKIRQFAADENEAIQKMFQV